MPKNSSPGEAREAQRKTSLAVLSSALVIIGILRVYVCAVWQNRVDMFRCSHICGICMCGGGITMCTCSYVFVYVGYVGAGGQFQCVPHSLISNF